MAKKPAKKSKKPLKSSKSKQTGLKGKVTSLLNRKYSLHILFATAFIMIGVVGVLISYAAVPTGPVKNVGNGKCLENFFDRQLDGNFLSTYPCNNDKAQKWYIYDTDKSIRTAQNYCVDVQKGGTTPMTKVHLWRCTGGVPQKWDKLSTGQLRNPNSGLCLEAGSTNTFLGGPPMYVNTCDANNKRQVWTLPASTVPLPIPTPPPTNPTPTPTPPPPTGMPSPQSIIDNAGPKESTSTSKGTFTITASGTYTNFNASQLYVKANNVTVRNCRVVGSGSYPVQLVNGYSNLTIEDCYLANTGGSATVTETGTNLTIRRSVIKGHNGDAIKATQGGLYEYNVIMTSKSDSSHADGIQSQAKGNWKARYNYIDTPASAGGNIGLFQQSWNGGIGKCLNVTDVEWSYNYLRGGNYGLGIEGYKSGSCTPGKYITNMRVVGNRLADGPLDGTIWRHTYCRLDAGNIGGFVATDNKFISGKVPGGCNI